jgi:histidyl-tRNA synthetase
MERIILLLKQGRPETAAKPAGVFLASLGEAARNRIFLLAQQLRAQGITTELDHEGRSLKSQMRRADRLNSRYVLILGEDELNRGEIQLRDMQDKSQIILPLDSAIPTLMEKVAVRAS